MKFIDTHCHPYLLKTKTLEDIFINFKNSGGTHMVSIGVDINSSIKSIELAEKNDIVFASVGIHPCDCIKLYNDRDNVLKRIEELIKNKKVVALGETGLDYHWISKENREEEEKIQKFFFREQINLAKKYSLPIIIHNRESKEDVLEILIREDFKNFIFHCYSEDLEYANRLIGFSPECKISFSGIVTFKNGTNIAETAQNIPLKNILVETDAPYLTPVPYRGKQENEPAYTMYNLEKILELRDENKDEIINQIHKNSKEVFGIS